MRKRILVYILSSKIAPGGNKRPKKNKQLIDKKYRNGVAGQFKQHLSYSGLDLLQGSSL